MLFAVDAHAIGCRLTGNEVYVRSLLAAMAELPGNWELLAYVASDEAEQWVPRRFARRRVPADPVMRLGFQLSRRLWQDRPALLHVQYTAPLWCPVPVIVTVHDVSFLERPEFFRRWRRLQLRLTVRRTVQRAARILTGSEFSARAIARHYGRDPSEIVVIPHAASTLFRPVAREVAKAYVRRRFLIDSPFILTVGDLQPRKNQIGLIRAFSTLLRELPSCDLRLVVAGKQTWFASQVYRAAACSGAGERIHFTGFVSDHDLLHLYNACELFVFPSFYEGFGLPLLEAMACGTPVACSSTTALPEVADAAAVLFDPASTRSMVRVLRDLLLDGELRSRMGRLGQQRAAQFSWRKTAERTLQVYHEVASPAAVPTRTLRTVTR